MSIAQYLLAEFERQAPITRRFLERVPEDKYTWKPHTKSMTAGQLAYHLATTPGRVVHFVQVSQAEAPKFGEYQQPANRLEVLKALDESVDAVRLTLSKFDDIALLETFRLTADGNEIMAVPRVGFLRDVMLSHWYQHRGQLSVYLRLLDVAVPASFGPSADEPPIFMQKKAQAA